MTHWRYTPKICSAIEHHHVLLDLADEHDRLLTTNSFSKAWLMTGWRLGWISAPPGVVAQLGTIVEYNTSCAPGFVQLAGIAAMEQGEGVGTGQRYAPARRARDYLCDALNQLPGISASPPDGAMYVFFECEQARREGSPPFAQRLVTRSRLGAGARRRVRAGRRWFPALVHRQLDRAPGTRGGALARTTESLIKTRQIA